LSMQAVLKVKRKLIFAIIGGIMVCFLALWKIVDIVIWFINNFSILRFIGIK